MDQNPESRIFRTITVGGRELIAFVPASEYEREQKKHLAWQRDIAGRKDRTLARFMWPYGRMYKVPPGRSVLTGRRP